jgi:hypothetical protein
MPTMTFLGLAERVLTEERRPLSPSEIWKVAVGKGYAAMLRSQGKTPAQTLYASIFTDARSNPETRFIKVGDRPARYYLKDLARGKKAAELEQAASTTAPIPEKYDYRESQLHSFLAHFVHVQFGARSKTIRHATSKKNEFGEWVHPDMIGVFYPDWRDEVLDLSQMTGGFAVKLYSFEIKKELSFANLRESFFQAVSNSSFAHEGYLVAADISTDEDFRSELRRLSASFGIGIIELDIEDPTSSHVLVPAKERETLDWDALNKVAMNKDVQDLLKRIGTDLRAKEVRVEEYDKIVAPEELVASIRPRT